jgi:hypothetical protein
MRVFSVTLFSRYRGAVPDFHVATTGSAPRLVLVHGGVATGAITWQPLLPLTNRFTLVIPECPGYPPFPKLVVSGAHNAAFDAVADVLERRLGAERAVVPGMGHSVQRAPAYNETLLRFLESA